MMAIINASASPVFCFLRQTKSFKASSECEKSSLRKGNLLLQPEGT